MWTWISITTAGISGTDQYSGNIEVFPACISPSRVVAENTTMWIFLITMFMFPVFGHLPQRWQSCPWAEPGEKSRFLCCLRAEVLFSSLPLSVLLWVLSVAPPKPPPAFPTLLEPPPQALLLYQHRWAVPEEELFCTLWLTRFGFF